jgi:hypothetical protein
MITPELSPIDEANKDEIEMYYEVEETMVKAGELHITKKELYEDIDNHESIYFLKTHDHFHYFTILSSIGIGWLAYTNYSLTYTVTFHTIALALASIAMVLLSWLITHPRLKYENEARDYFRTHRTLFLYKD